MLSFEGLRLTDEGKLEPCKQTRTISEAEAAAGQLRRKLIDRGVHPDVLKFCRTEQAALDMMTVASLLHRRLDEAVKAGD